jgi:hypothetical protein
LERYGLKEEIVTKDKGKTISLEGKLTNEAEKVSSKGKYNN